MGAIFGVLYAARAIMRLDRVVVGAGACGGGAGSEGAPEASLLHDGRVCHQAPSDGASV